MSPDRRTLAVSLAVVLFVAACGGSAATTAPGAATPAASQASGATDAASTPAAATQEPAATDTGPGPTVSLTPGTASELEGMLPSTVNGMTFTKTSFDGGSFPAVLPIDSGDFGTFLKDNGKTLADFSFAEATPTDPAKAGTILIMAFQVKGVDGTKLAEMLGGGPSSGLETATVGGKKVQQSAAGGMGLILYTKGDTVFYILAFGDASLTEGILAALP
jgi:hypothetical protein